MRHLRAYVVSLVVVLLFSWYYLSYLHFPLSLNYINAIIAFSSTIIITFSFLLGPLASLGGFFRRLLADRKPYGLIGFGLGAIHALLSVPIMLASTKAATIADVGSLVFAALAFLIFSIMALTSTSKWMKLLGVENWKNLQRTGYAALVFTLMHVILIKQGALILRTTGEIAIIIIMAALLLRAVTFILGTHHGEKPIL